MSDKDTGISAEEAAEQFVESTEAPEEDTPDDESTPDLEPDNVDQEEDPEDEPEPEEDSEEGEPEGDESEEDADPEPESKTLDAIEIDGSKIPLEEVKKGYLRQSDYTRKTQELADKRNEFDGQVGTVAQELKTLHDTLSAYMPEEPNWDALYEEDPIEAPRLERQWNTRKAALEQARKVFEEQESKKVQEARQKSIEALRTIDRWQSQDTFEKDMKSTVSWAQSKGIKKESLSIADQDPAMVEALWKASQYDALHDAKPMAEKKARSKPKVTKPGVRSGDKGQRLAKELAAKAKKSGSVDDAAKAWMARRG